MIDSRKNSNKRKEKKHKFSLCLLGHSNINSQSNKYPIALRFHYPSTLNEFFFSSRVGCIRYIYEKRNRQFYIMRVYKNIRSDGKITNVGFVANILSLATSLAKNAQKDPRDRKINPRRGNQECNVCIYIFLFFFTTNQMENFLCNIFFFSYKDLSWIETHLTQYTYSNLQNYLI